MRLPAPHTYCVGGGEKHRGRCSAATCAIISSEGAAQASSAFRRFHRAAPRQQAGALGNCLAGLCLGPALHKCNKHLQILSSFVHKNIFMNNQDSLTSYCTRSNQPKVIKNLPKYPRQHMYVLTPWKLSRAMQCGDCQNIGITVREKEGVEISLGSSANSHIVAFKCPTALGGLRLINIK